MFSESKGGVKKLVTVSVTSTPVTVAREEAIGENLRSNFARVPCIRYPINFGKKFVSVLLNSDSEVNAIHLAFAKELSLPIRLTDVRAQKIVGITLETYGMVIVAFLVENKANRVRFFKETFLVANISPEIVFEMSFLTLSGADIDFLRSELRWKTYTTKEAFPTTRHVELVDKEEFSAAALNPESETFVVHVASLSSNALPSSSLLELDVHPFRRPQVSGLIAKEALTKVSAEYSDFADVFSPNLASELPKHTEINDHAIKLVNGQQPPYGPIYSLEPVELKTLKAYIVTNLVNGFIRPSKSPAGAPILFDRKSNGSLHLCINYRGPNNLTIKNRYPLPLIEELLDRLGRARRFTQLDLTSAYHQMRIRKGDEWKTAFRTRYGHFEYQVIPFGLANTPASFQGYINKILTKKLDIFVIVYLDDILIYTEDDGNSHVVAV